MAFNLSVTAQELNNAVAKANAAAPQSTTYTKTETDALLANKPGVTDTATQGSADLITSGGVYTILGNINAVLEEVL